VDFQEAEEHALLRQAVAKLAAEHGHQAFTAAARQGTKLDDLWHALGEAGLLGVAVPEEFGGGGGGIFELAIVCEELAAAGCPLLLLIVSPAICASVIARSGTPEQRERWLPRFATGELTMAFAITEPDAGSNSHRIAVQARRDGDVYRLSGTKHFISGCDQAEAVLVVARSGSDPATGRAQLSLFVVDLTAPGVSMAPIPVEICSPEKQFTLYLDDVAVPTSHLVGTEHEGLHQVFVGLNPERITAAALSVGIGRYALEKAAAYARERRVWDVPIGSHQGLAHPLAEAKVHLELARLMMQRAAWCYDHGVEAGEWANMAKLAAADASLECLDRAIQTHGGLGLTRDVGLADLWGLARLLKTAPVSREMVLNFVAQHSLGLPRSY
jgi:alkylation response protein AidB-like acyl-CoA dehydrogenase